jgi:signal transduction histidine kinase
MTIQHRKLLFPWQRGLQGRLTVISLLFALVPLAIVGFLIFSQARASLLAQAAANVEEISAATGAGVAQFFETSLGDIKLIATSPIMTAADSTLIQKADYLRSVYESYGYYKAIYVTDTNGAVVVSTDQTGGDQSTADWFLKSKQGQVNVTDVYFLNSVADYVVTFSAPIRSETGEFLGVVAEHIAGQKLFDVVGARNVGATGKIILVNGNSRVVAAKDLATLFEDLSSLAFIAVGHAGQSGSAVTNDPITGVPTLFSYVPISETQNWLAVGTLPLSEVNAPIDALAANTGLVAGLATLFVSIIAFFVTRGIALPVRQLAQAASTIGQGHWDVEVPEVKTADEIGQLSLAFSTMSKELKANYNTLEDHVNELEKSRVEREKLIKDLQAAKRLADENSRLKSEFLSTMSHELRTPLNAIEGFTGIMLNKIGGTDYNSKTEEYLTRIRSNSKRLLQLINDFLDLSRVEAGRLELANQPFSPQRLAKRWHDEISVLAEKKGIQVEVSLDSSLPEMLYGDDEAISKIAINLLGNAIKFTEHGQVKLALECTSGTWGITVHDTGIGIPPHAREFIFEEFRQVDQTSKRKYGGTGLGLAIVQKYARAMGGSVNVKSEVGKGSTFIVSLPMRTTALI